MDMCEVIYKDLTSEQDEKKKNDFCDINENYDISVLLLFLNLL